MYLFNHGHSYPHSWIVKQIPLKKSTEKHADETVMSEKQKKKIKPV